MFYFNSNVIAQTEVKGTVTDGDNIPLIGASVYEKANPSNGTITDIDGNYSITVASNAAILVSSYVGYSTKEMAVEGSTDVINFVLYTDALGLDEIVVTGVVNSRSKLESSVSMTTLKPNQIEQSAPRTTAEIFRAQRYRS